VSSGVGDGNDVIAIAGFLESAVWSGGGEIKLVELFQGETSEVIEKIFNDDRGFDGLTLAMIF